MYAIFLLLKRNLKSDREELMLVVHYIGSNLVIQVGPVSAGGSSTCLLGAKFMSATIEVQAKLLSSRLSTCLPFP